MSSVQKATSRKTREGAHPQLSRARLKDKPALYFAVKLAHPPSYLPRTHRQRPIAAPRTDRGGGNASLLLVLVGLLRLTLRRNGLPALLCLYNCGFGNLEQCCHSPFKVSKSLRPFCVFRLLHGVIMRLSVAIALLALLSLPTNPKNQQNKTTEQKAISQTPSQPSPVIVVVNQSPPPEKAKDPDYQASKVQPQTNQKWYEWLIPAVLSFLANLALVGVAIWGVNVAANSLEEVRRQAKATEDAATAAKDSAQAVINAERAWVMVDMRFCLGSHLTKITSGDGSIHTAAKVEISLQNCGPTPAWIFEQWVCLEVANFVVMSATEYPTPQFPQFGKEGKKSSVNYSILPMVKGQEPEKWTTSIDDDGWATDDNGRYVHIYGVVRYRDAFSSLRETYFGYGVWNGQLERMPSEAYNHHT